MNLQQGKGDGDAAAMTEPDCGRAPRWQRRPEQRRREILEAALWAFSHHGYERATLAQVAERAGVCPGTVSHYFGPKSDLFEAVIADRFGGVIEEEELLAAAHRGSSRALLHHLLRRIWDQAWTPGVLQLIQVVQAETAAFPDSGRLLCRQLSERWRLLFCRIFEAGMADGEFTRHDPPVAARVVLYSLFGVAQKLSAFAPFDPGMPEREVMWGAVLQMIDRYLMAPTDRESAAGLPEGVACE